MIHCTASVEESQRLLVEKSHSCSDAFQEYYYQQIRIHWIYICKWFVGSNEYWSNDFSITIISSESMNRITKLLTGVDLTLDEALVFL